MLGKEILSAFIKHFHTTRALNLAEFDIQLDEGFVTLDEAFNLIINHAGIGNLKPFIQCLSPTSVGLQFLEDRYTPAIRLDFIDFTLIEFVKRKRSFGFSNEEFGYLTLSELFSLSDQGALNSTSEEFKSFLDFIATAMTIDDLVSINSLIGYLSNRNENIGILIHKNNVQYTVLSAYAYIYYKDLLRGKQLPLNPSLNYSIPYTSVVSFSPAIIYEQYFEVFDIINELNHSVDIITRYLKVYHILEYLVYRVELVELERRARVNRSFIREIHSLTGKNQSDKEFDVLKRNFNKIFLAELAAGAFNLTLNAAQLDFIRNHFSIPIFTQGEVSSVCALIYRIRNSIVHNKESEFHITSTNPDDYNIIIPVIKELIQKLESQIFNKISSNSTQIQYQSQNIQLY